MYEYLKPEDSLLLDRLVDDELTDVERRDLLQRLERTPDGWRRCALAFLEHQAWRSESKSFATGVPHVEARPTPAAVGNRHWSARSFWMPLSMAACLFVMVGVWVVIRDKDGNSVARIQVPEAGSVVMSPAEIGSSHGLKPPVKRPGVQFVRPDDAANVRFVVDGGTNEPQEVVEVPLVEAERLNEALFGQWSQAVPPEVLQMLEQSGHQVVRQRRLVPVDLRDGRRVVVPMDQVEIVPVSVRGYQ